MGSIINQNSFEKQVDDLLIRYPRMFRQVIDNKTILKGELDLIDNFGVHQDTYCIEIHPVPEYPYRFPFVFETGGKIPRNIDWHIYESDGHCCLSVEPEEILICRNGINLTDFVEKQVVPFFFNQTFRRINGYFINERSHGLLGIIEFYQQQLKEKNPLKLLQLLRFVLNGIEPNRVDLCFCGKKIKYRKCHRDPYRQLRQIDQSILTEHVNALSVTLKRIC
ncbi:MAG: hypothetical protein JNK14_07655 [Chitinophagaceae bacterium]|nr:hypothetical protein [Chitinophagaceae bacterium]